MKQTTYEKIKDFILKEEMYYISSSYSCNVPLNLLVDDETNPTSVCAYAEENDLVIYGENLAFLDQVYARFVRGKRTVYFSATDKFVIDYFVTKRKVKIYTTCSTVVYDTASPKYVSQYTLGVVTPEYYKVVEDYYQYPVTAEEIAYCGANLPTSALFDGEKMICWVMVHAEGSIGPLYTLPEYRGKGLAKVVLADLFGKMLDRGLLPYSYIVKGNTNSEALVDKCGSRFGKRTICYAEIK